MVSTPSQQVPPGRFGLVFGGGMRECLGKEFARLEMKLFAAKLLQGYTWDLLPDQDLSLVTIPTPHPKDELKVRLAPVKTESVPNPARNL